MADTPIPTTDDGQETPGSGLKKLAPKATPATPEALRAMNAANKLAAVDKLTREYKEVERANDPESITIRTKLRRQLLQLTCRDLHPLEQIVEMDVPRAVDGSIFTINDREFLGVVHVPECVAQQLAYMISHNKRIDAERFRDGGRTFNLGDIGARSRVIQAED